MTAKDFCFPVQEQETVYFGIKIFVPGGKICKMKIEKWIVFPES